MTGEVEWYVISQMTVRRIDLDNIFISLLYKLSISNIYIT